ncbi:MAG TPA: 16S rRNA (cytidine(1402)-2'-O)-methyltransferase, partial [Bacilli bacterium]|nr:16S rRNA (cytidine(1402)-2'-O)-methyltransferase [Bacilli bacterium]
MKLNKSFSTTPFYLVATPIGNLSEISPRVKETLNAVDFIACEDSRVTRKLLSHLDISKTLISLHQFNEEAKSKEIIERIRAGQKGAYVSDAGYPLISDPGSRLVKSLLDANIFISVINGPSALLPALIGSGLPSDHFYFHGFLDLKAKALELEYLKAKKETLIFYEAPHRI